MGNKIDQSNPNVLTINANGENTYSNVSNILKPIHYKKIWVGNCQTFALDYKNNLYSWGLNDYFQLGNKKNTEYIFNKEKESKNKKTKIYDTFKCLKTIFPIPGNKIRKISTGDGFTLFLTKEGKVYSLGKNNKCQLGYQLPFNQSEIINGSKCSKIPNEIVYFSKNNIFIVNIFSGSDFSFAEDNKGTFYSWGCNEHSQLARSNNNKTKYEILPSKADLIPNDITIEIFTCGWMHCIVKSYSGDLFIWGNLFYDYDTRYKDIVIPEKMDLIDKKVIGISSGFHHICFICSYFNQNELYSFGVNDCGQLGYISNSVICEVPKKVEFPLKKNISQVSCGAFHTICKMSDESVYGFGQNEHREVGLYQSDKINYPSLVNWINENDNKSILRILCGNGFTYILKVNKGNYKINDKDDDDYTREYSNINS
jgi:regulator of chromosome condensation